MSTRIEDTHATRTLYSREKEYSDESLFLNFRPGGAIQIESRFSQTTFGEEGPWFTSTELYLIDAGNALRLQRALLGDVTLIDERDRRNRIFAAMDKELGANAKIGDWLASLGVRFTRDATRSQDTPSDDDAMDEMMDMEAMEHEALKGGYTRGIHSEETVASGRGQVAEQIPGEGGTTAELGLLGDLFRRSRDFDRLNQIVASAPSELAEFLGGRDRVAEVMFSSGLDYVLDMVRRFGSKQAATEIDNWLASIDKNPERSSLNASAANPNERIKNLQEQYHELEKVAKEHGLKNPEELAFLKPDVSNRVKMMWRKERVLNASASVW